MGTTELINEIKSLPLDERLFVVEEAIKSIRKEEIKHQMSLASDTLFEVYKNDKELTSLTDLDLEDFYEAR